MHILLIYKLINKASGIQANQKRYKHSQKQKQNKKSSKISNIFKNGHLTPTPKLHNVLIVGTKTLKSNTTAKPY